MRLALSMLGLLACADQVDPGDRRPPAPTEPSTITPHCSISSEPHGDVTTVYVTGVLNGHGHLRGGAVTVDNQALFFLQVPVESPFSVGTSFATPAPTVDWQYVIHLEDGVRPGITVCQSAGHGEGS